MNLHFRRIDSQLAVLLAAGFSAEQAARAYHTLSTYTRGCLLNERSARVTSGGSLDERLPQVLVDDPSALPALAQASAYWSASFATDEDFAVGLETLIDGLAHALSGNSARP